MGQSDSKSKQYEEALAQFSSEEKRKLQLLYEKLAGQQQPKIAADSFLSYVCQQIGFSDATGKKLLNYLRNVMGPHHVKEGIPADHFTIGLSHILKGDTTMRAEFIFFLSSDSGASAESISVKLLFQFVEALLNLCNTLLTREAAGKSWSLINIQQEHIKQFVWGLLSYITTNCEGRNADSCKQLLVSTYDISTWLSKHRLVDAMFEYVFYTTFPICHAPVSPLVPEVLGDGDVSASMLSLPLVMYINFHLPQLCRSHWRLLFSSRKHGESFGRLIKQISSQGPTVLIVRDADGHVFGGFASVSWDLNAKFTGSEQCFLFSLLPKMGVYYASGLNRNFMYLNYGQETVPNGLGMGGQHGYCGLWLDPDYGSGHSRARPRCSTYDSPQLSGKENFALSDIEVWAVTAPRVERRSSDADQDSSPSASRKRPEKSILDKDPLAKAVMEWAGKKTVSDGLREADRK